MTTLSFDQFVKQAGGTTKDVQVLTPTNQVKENLSPGFLDNFKNNITSGIQSATSEINNTNQNPILSGIKATGDIANIAGKSVGDVINKIPGVSAVTGAIEKGFKSTTDTIANTKLFQEASKYPEQTKVLENFLSAGGSLGDIANNILLATGAGKGTKVSAEGVGNTVAPIAEKTGQVLKASGEGAYGLTIPPTEATARAVLNYDAKQPSLLGRVKNFVSGEQIGTKPITEANTAARMGLTGTEYQLGVQAKKIGSGLWTDVIQPKLNAVKGKVDMKSFINEIEKEIKKTGDLTRRNDLTEALNKVKEDYKNVSKVSLEKLQNYKEGWAEFVPEATYKGKPIGSSLKKVHDLMAEKARQIIYKNIGNEGKQAYLDYGNLKTIEKSALKSIVGDPATKSLSRNIWQFVMDKAITPVATVSGKILYKTGDGLELIGKKGAKKIGDIIKQ